MATYSYNQENAIEIFGLALLCFTHAYIETYRSSYRFRDFSFTQNVAAKHPIPKRSEGIKAATVAT